MKLKVLEGTFAVCRLPVTADVKTPPSGGFISVTRTSDEVSIVCEESKAPPGATIEGSWRCLRVAGQIPFETVGLLASLTAPLAAAEISVFAVSTFDTDYLLAKTDDWEKLITTLRSSGFEFQTQ